MYTRFNQLSRAVMYLLVLGMGLVEHWLRLATDSPEQTQFFAPSLVVAGIGLMIALTASPPPLDPLYAELLDDPDDNAFSRAVMRVANQAQARPLIAELAELRDRAQRLQARRESEMRQVTWAIGLSLVGVLLWFGVMCATLSKAVAAEIPDLHLWGGSTLVWTAGIFYFIASLMTEWRARSP